MRLIDADKLLDSFGENGCYVDGCVECVEDAPTVDPEKHGRLICVEPMMGLYGCSQCGKRIMMHHCYYCPQCGAKFDLNFIQNQEQKDGQNVPIYNEGDD